jgi:hypothetical protein
MTISGEYYDRQQMLPSKFLSIHHSQATSTATLLLRSNTIFLTHSTPKSGDAQQAMLLYTLYVR